MPGSSMLRRICRLKKRPRKIREVLTNRRRHCRMRQLFIVRHAQAEDGHGKKDFGRALTPKGRIDAQQLGLYMKEKNLTPQQILVSPARRTMQTLSQIKLAFGDRLDEEPRPEIYNASLDELLALILSADDAIQSLMIVGHNPGMHALAVYFSGRREQPAHFPPATLCALGFDTSWGKIEKHAGITLVLRATEEF